MIDPSGSQTMVTSKWSKIENFLKNLYYPKLWKNFSNQHTIIMF